VRINPRIYFGHTMSNAQVAALGSVLVGAVIMFVTRHNQAVVPQPLPSGVQKPAAA
jgi:phosphatidylglycerol---prolipoprotein diacylglyceryl transferase